MKDLHTQEQIDEMRKRLYSRGEGAEKIDRHQLTDTKVDVSRDWAQSQAGTPTNTTDLRKDVPVGDVPATPPVAKPKRHYRAFVLLGSLLIFVLVAAVSSFFVYNGGNQISSDKIMLSIQGPSSLGGGEEASLQVTVANQNTVVMESVTLILHYPIGTRSVGDAARNLFEDRIPLSDLAPGEVQNVPIRIAVFGEEGSEKVVAATLEYRINGSNSMFYKDATPLALQINSSPLVLRVESIEKVASGQLVDITLSAVSNASTPLKDLLITASYPNGFSYESASPEPVFGENVWRIDELLPEGTATIHIQGVVTGLTEETFRINFAAGPANPDNQYLVGATLTDTGHDFVVERPFIDIAVTVNDDKSNVVILDEAEKSTVDIKITNTLEETVYDMVVAVVPQGNALSEDSIESTRGYYDSNTGSVRWEVSNNESFDRVLPGDSRTLSFSVEPNSTRSTASYELEVQVYARRVNESSAQETLIGTTKVEAKYSAHVAVGSQVGRSSASFVDMGPVPPRVGETTTYTITLVAEAGANDLANAIVDTALPLYVEWLDMYEGDGSIIYNSVSKKIQWDIGSIAAGTQKKLNLQVSIKPSVSQAGDAPVLLNTQYIKANDRFTSALLQDSAPAVTTELSTEMGYSEYNGEVVR